MGLNTHLGPSPDCHLAGCMPLPGLSHRLGCPEWVPFLRTPSANAGLLKPRGPRPSWGVTVLQKRQIPSSRGLQTHAHTGV